MPIKWEDYYDRFWDWAESTQISRISELTDFISSAEVAEIANEFFDEKNSTRLANGDDRGTNEELGTVFAEVYETLDRFFEINIV